MTSRKGSLLEKNVDHIFKSMGFITQTNVKKVGYEIDVLARKGNFEIICECKQYENSSLILRNLIHQWSDKNSEINADRVLLVLYGINIKDSDRVLASSRNIVLWDEQRLEEYLDLIVKNNKEAYRKLVSEFNIKTSNNWKIRLINEVKDYFMLILMSGRPIEEYEDALYEDYLFRLEAYIKNVLRAKLSEDYNLYRIGYTEIFSNVESEGIYKNKWNTLKKIIKDSDRFTSNERKVIVNYMNEIERIFEQGKAFFSEKDKVVLRGKLIKTALNYSRQFNVTLVFMSKQNQDHTLKFKEGYFTLELDAELINPDKLDELDWLIDEPKEISKNSNLGDHEYITAYWSVDNDINKAQKYVESIFLNIIGENKNFDIVLERPYKDALRKEQSIREDEQKSTELSSTLEKKTSNWMLVGIAIFFIGSLIFGLSDENSYQTAQNTRKLTIDSNNQNYPNMPTSSEEIRKLTIDNISKLNDEAFVEAAIASANVSLCNKLSGSKREDCIIRFARTNWHQFNLSLCETLRESIVVECYMSAVNVSNNPNICITLSNPINIKDCYSHFGVQLKKVSLNKTFTETYNSPLAFRSADGTVIDNGLPIHIVNPNEPVYSYDVPNSVTSDWRFVVEEVN